jgi:hypothetical protein
VSAPSANDLYKAAQVLIRQGQPVFPCRTQAETLSNGKVRKAKTPVLVRNGLKDATLDKAQVKRWIKQRGDDLALGIPTGIVYDVLDVDTKGEYDGRVHLPRLAKLGLLNGCQKIVKTPSNGWHLYFKSSPGVTNKANATLGLDARGLGGYVLAPPSWINDEESSIGAYVQHDDPRNNTDEPLMWDLIVRTLSPVNTITKKPIDLLGYEKQASVKFLRGWLSERHHGERNNALHWAVCRCIENGIDPNELFEVAVLTGLEEEEINLTINSALKRAGVAASDLYTEAEAMFGRD